MTHISCGAVATRCSSEVFIWTKFGEIPQHIPEILDSRERGALENIHHMLFLAMAIRGIRQQVYNNFLIWQKNEIILYWHVTGRQSHDGGGEHVNSIES